MGLKTGKTFMMSMVSSPNENFDTVDFGQNYVLWLSTNKISGSTYF